MMSRLLTVFLRSSLFISLISGKRFQSVDHESHWWKLNEGKGRVAKDSARGNTTETSDIILHSNPDWVDSKVSPNGWQCLNFISSEGHYGISDHRVEISYNQPISVSFWFQSSMMDRSQAAERSKSYKYILGFGSDEDRSIWVGSYLNSHSKHGQTKYELSPFNRELNDSEWHFGVFTNFRDEQQYYFDGFYENNRMNDWGFNKKKDKKNQNIVFIYDFVIGKVPCCDGKYWDGMLSDIRVFDGVLSENDMKWLYNGGKGRSMSIRNKNRRYSSNSNNKNSNNNGVNGYNTEHIINKMDNIDNVMNGRIETNKINKNHAFTEYFEENSVEHRSKHKRDKHDDFESYDDMDKIDHDVGHMHAHRRSSSNNNDFNAFIHSKWIEFLHSDNFITLIMIIGTVFVISLFVCCYCAFKTLHIYFKMRSKQKI